ncbi:hypothetical protein PILCRDRAFT_93982, partial [Piloderma croceum F 1598]
MPNKFPDVGYFPEPPRGDRPLTVRNLLKLDKLFSDAEGKVEDPPSSSMEAVIASDEGDEVFTESEWEEDEIDPPSSPACPSVNIIKNRSKPTRKRKAKLGV